MSDSDPLIDALTTPPHNDTPGRTSGELARAIGKSKASVMPMLKALLDAGKLRVHRVPRQSIDGRMLHTTTYELVKDTDA